MNRVEKEPEFLPQALHDWAKINWVLIYGIQSGLPRQNALIERFNRNHHNEIFDLYLFRSLEEV